MANTVDQNLMSPYRVLDLTDDKGMLCGKILGDLGADVIKIERPGGDSARNDRAFLPRYTRSGEKPLLVCLKRQ